MQKNIEYPLVICLSVFNECHLADGAVDDDGEVAEEVVADHAFVWNIFQIVLGVAAKDLERMAGKLARNAAHGHLEGAFGPAAFVGNFSDRELSREVVHIRKRRASVDIVHTLNTTDSHIDEPAPASHKRNRLATFQQNRVFGCRNLAVRVIELRITTQRFHARNMQVWDTEELVDPRNERFNRIGVSSVYETLLPVDFDDRHFLNKFKLHLTSFPAIYNNASSRILFLVLAGGAVDAGGAGGGGAAPDALVGAWAVPVFACGGVDASGTIGRRAAPFAVLLVVTVLVLPRR